jgi:hypothetical protein
VGVGKQQLWQVISAFIPISVVAQHLSPDVTPPDIPITWYHLVGTFLVDHVGYKGGLLGLKPASINEVP